MTCVTMCHSAHPKCEYSSKWEWFAFKGVSVAAWSVAALFPREKPDMQAVKHSIQKWQPTLYLRAAVFVCVYVDMFKGVYCMSIFIEDTFLCQRFSPENQICLQQSLQETASSTKELQSCLTSSFIWQADLLDNFLKRLKDTEPHKRITTWFKQTCQNTWSMLCKVDHIVFYILDGASLVVGDTGNVGSF